jgi:stress-induced morphogen
VGISQHRFKRIGNTSGSVAALEAGLDKLPTSLRFHLMPSADEVKSRIEAGIPGAAAEVQTYDEVHFDVVVRASAFEGLTRVKQHRLVMDIFTGELGGAIHALALKTEVPT